MFDEEVITHKPIRLTTLTPEQLIIVQNNLERLVGYYEHATDCDECFMEYCGEHWSPCEVAHQMMNMINRWV